MTSLRGRLHDALRLRRLRVDDPLAPHTFELSFPSRAAVNVSDSGFRRVDLREAARIVPYVPLVPAEVPNGYRLAEVAVARDAARTGAQELNPPSRMVVSLS